MWLRKLKTYIEQARRALSGKKRKNVGQKFHVNNLNLTLRSL